MLSIRTCNLQGMSTYSVTVFPGVKEFSFCPCPTQAKRRLEWGTINFANTGHTNAREVVATNNAQHCAGRLPLQADPTWSRSGESSWALTARARHGCKIRTGRAWEPPACGNLRPSLAGSSIQKNSCNFYADNLWLHLEICQ